MALERRRLLIRHARMGTAAVVVQALGFTHQRGDARGARAVHDNRRWGQVCLVGSMPLVDVLLVEGERWAKAHGGVWGGSHARQVHNPLGRMTPHWSADAGRLGRGSNGHCKTQLAVRRALAARASSCLAVRRKRRCAKLFWQTSMLDAGCWMLTIFWCIRGKGQLPAVMDTMPALVFGGLRCEHGAGGARQLFVEPSLCRGARPSASTSFLTSLLSRYLVSSLPTARLSQRALPLIAIIQFSSHGP